MPFLPALAPVYRTAELRAVEASARKLPLMERAGHAAAEVARTMAGERGGAILVLAGPGNNGGDAFVVARWLRQWFFVPTVVFRAEPSKLPSDAAAAHRAYLDAGGTTVPDMAADWQGALIVDGLFGIGLARELSPDYAALVETANASGVPILALDIPTGLDADTGVARGSAIRAAATATFLALKPGLLTGPDCDLCGIVSVHSLDVEAATGSANGHRLDWPILAASLPDASRHRRGGVESDRRADGVGGGSRRAHRADARNASSRRGRPVASEIRGRGPGGPDRVSAGDRHPAPRVRRSQGRGQRARVSGWDLRHQCKR